MQERRRVLPVAGLLKPLKASTTTATVNKSIENKPGKENLINLSLSGEKKKRMNKIILKKIGDGMIDKKEQTFGLGKLQKVLGIEKMKKGDHKRLKQFKKTFDIYNDDIGSHSKQSEKRTRKKRRRKKKKKSMMIIGKAVKQSNLNLPRAPVPPTMDAARPKKNKPITRGGRKIVKQSENKEFIEVKKETETLEETEQPKQIKEDEVKAKVRATPGVNSEVSLSLKDEAPNIKILFKMIDTNDDGLITPNEFLISIEKNQDIMEFIASVPSFSPFLSSLMDIKIKIENTIVDSMNCDQLNENTFHRLCNSIIYDVPIDIQTYKENVLKFDSIDQLFLLLDSNKDGILTYDKILDGVNNPLVINIINNEQPIFKNLLHPDEINDLLKIIADNSTSGILNRQTFRSFIAMQETPDLSNLFGDDGEVYGDDY